MRRCCRTIATRTAGHEAIADTTDSTSGRRIIWVTSRSPMSTVYARLSVTPGSGRSIRMGRCSARLVRSGSLLVAMPCSKAARATARYIAPVSRKR